MEELQNKLMNDFNVKISNHSQILNQDPIMTLEFPLEVTQQLNLVISKPRRQNLLFFTIKATSFAKYNNYVLPFVTEPKVHILSRNPYKIQIQGIYPLIYFFVNCILTEK